jgi:hypothetical protein
LTLPPQLRAFTSESTSDWECDWESPVMSCTHVGDFAPGESTRVIRRTVEVREVTPGDELAVSTSVTTSSPEASTGNNTASRVIRIVDTGEVRGRLWNDLNADGVRQAGEPAATSVGLSIRSQDDEDQYGFSNNHGGSRRRTSAVTTRIPICGRCWRPVIPSTARRPSSWWTRRRPPWSTWVWLPPIARRRSRPRPLHRGRPPS